MNAKASRGQFWYPSIFPSFMPASTLRCSTKRITSRAFSSLSVPENLIDLRMGKRLVCKS